MAIGNEGTVVAAGSELTQAQATVQVWYLYLKLGSSHHRYLS
jgi:hypothetical protein